LTQPTPEFDAATAVTVGRIGAAHGIRGEVKVEPLTDFPERFAPHARLYLNGEIVVVETSRWSGRSVFVKFRGINDRTAAEALNGQELQVPELQPIAEPDVYYQHDIVGLAVETEAGESLGTVESIFSTGANDVFVIKGERGELLLPAIDDVIKQVDTAAGRLVIDLLPGLEFTRPASAPRPRRPARNKTEGTENQPDITNA
jgi:16S rRNA processing protein RimM